MCGIFGYIGKQDTAAKIVFDGLKSLEYRGYDSWGVAVVPVKSYKLKVTSSKSPQIVVKKKIGKIGDANVNELPKSTFGFGHTRWATHGGVVEKNAHPHLDCTGEIAVIHNGIIENYDSLKKNLAHHKFQSDTDTEVAVHLIEDFAKEYPFPESVRKTFLVFG